MGLDTFADNFHEIFAKWLENYRDKHHFIKQLHLDSKFYSTFLK